MSKPCRHPDCEGTAHARGLCNRHYKQAAKADSTFTRDPRGTPTERFRRKVTRRGPDDCWHWTGATDKDGYGLYSITERDQERAHRYAYAEHHGPIPDGAVIDHDCHNRDPACPGGRTCPHRLCVNPAHLTPVTPTANVFTSTHTRAAINAARTTCHAGHPLSGDNLYVRPSNGERQCRTCRAARKRRYRANRQRTSTPTA